MPADPNTIAAVADGINQVANVTATVGSNRRQQKWAQETYDKQRKDSLQDWSMQNAYNSPAAQMQRLKDAGLNPHLIYGNGADATSASMPRSTDTPNVNYQAPHLDTMQAQNSLANFYDTQIKQATTDNLQVQKTVLQNEAALKAVQALGMVAGTEKTKEETTNLQQLRPMLIEAAKKNIEKMSVDIASTEANTQYTIAENMRKQQLQPITMQKAAEEIKNMVEQRNLSRQQRAEILTRIDNMIKEGKLKDWEIELSKQGIKPGDPLWQRKLTEMIREAGKPIKEVLKGNFKVKQKPPAKDILQWFERLSPG